ncbi:MAG: hypothetical protein LBK08_09100, partial [Treponema sp.]|nr:hypothetical protein [Treponema sp.]
LFIGRVVWRLGWTVVWLRPLGELFYNMSFSWITILQAAIAGFIGAALPPLLAKTGLYLGPFVTRKQAANGEAQK